jgi:pimeloyl-ACP methyl ester carboxylesterase
MVARMREDERTPNSVVGQLPAKLEGSHGPRPAVSLPLAAALVVGGVALSAAAVAAYLRYGAQRGADELLNPTPTESTQTLEAAGLPGETVEINSGDHTLSAWFVPAERDTQSAIALFHGHSSARSQLLPYAKFLRKDHHCLLVDFRACGDSEGPCSSLGVFEAEDVRAAVRYLQNRGFDHIGGWGMSMGGAALIRAAATMPEIEAVVTEGTFDRVLHVAAKRVRDRGYPLSRPLAGAILKEAGRRLEVDLQHNEPVELIGKLSPRPVLVIHGTEDGTSQVDNGHRLYRAAGYPKELFIVNGAAHTRCYQDSPGEYERRVLAFYRRYLARDGAVGPSA